MKSTNLYLFARPLVVAVFVLALLPFPALMFFAQPAIDDYDNAATVARLGPWGAQWYWYTHWSGRFVAIGVSTLYNPLSHGPRSGVEPAGLWALRGMLLLLLVGFVGTVQQLLRALLLVLPTADSDACPPHRLSWGLTLAITVLGLNALSEPFSLLYWYSGAVNYALPLVFTLGFAAAALRALRLPVATPARRRRGIAATLSLVGAVGSSEIALLSCLAIVGALGLWLRSSAAQGPQWRLWATWLSVAVAVGLLVLGAPGNWQRLGLADPDAAGRYHRWVWLLPRTLLTAARMAARPPVMGALLLLLVGVLLSVAGPVRPRPPRRQLLLVLAGYVAFNCLGVAFLKAAFMRDMWVEAMPARVVNVLVLQLLVSTAGLALWMRCWLPLGAGWLRRRPALLHAALVAVLLSGQVRRAWPELLLVAPAYRQQMHARYELLAAASRLGAPEAVLPPLQLPQAQGLLAPIPSAGQRADVQVELSQDAGQKNNLLLAHYYGLPQVRLSAPPAQRP